MKHTPGPWHLHALVNHADGVLNISGCLVASVYNPNVELQGANARLIAAAPELLEALKDLRLQLRAHMTFDVKKHYSLMVAEAAAGAAIAKAEGEG